MTSMKKMMSTMKKPGGFSLLEIMVVVGIGSIMALGFGKLLAWTAELQTQALEQAALDGFKQNIMKNLANESSWGNTLTANQAGATKCLWDGTPCTDSGAFGGAPLANQLIELRDSANTVIFDARQATNGLTAQGTPCVGYTAAGNDLCPYRYQLTWSALCNPAAPPAGDGCVAPQVSISAVLQYSPAKKDKATIDTSRLSVNQYFLKSPVTCQGGTQVYGSPGVYNFTVPNGYSMMVVEMWGGGGGGLAINSNSCGTTSGAAGGNSLFGGLLTANGGPGATSHSDYTLNTWIWCIWAGGPICGVIQWAQCPGGIAPAIEGGDGYPETTSAVVIPPSMNLCMGSTGTGGGFGGKSWQASGSAGGGGGAGNLHGGSFFVGGANWFVFDQWFAAGGGAIDPASPLVGAQTHLPTPWNRWWAAPPAPNGPPVPPYYSGNQVPWLSGNFARGVYNPTIVAPGSVITVTVGAGGAGGVRDGLPAGNGASGVVKITWR